MEENAVVTLIPMASVWVPKQGLECRNGESLKCLIHKRDYKVRGKADNFTNIPSFI